VRATVIGEWRAIHVRREGHFYLPLWCVDRINAAGDRWFEAASFETKAEALAYIKGQS
jgi:hypothetical protein